MRETFQSSVNSFHVILFYCGPFDNSDLIMKIGHNLLDQIEYTSEDGRILYKPDIADVMYYLLE